MGNGLMRNCPDALPRMRHAYFTCGERVAWLVQKYKITIKAAKEAIIADCHELNKDAEAIEDNTTMGIEQFCGDCMYPLGDSRAARERRTVRLNSISASETGDGFQHGNLEI